VHTVQHLGWSGATNGELLRRASGSFDVLVTGDQNLEFQQNIAALALGIVVVAARDNRVQTFIGLAPKIASAIETVKPGRLLRVIG
jgi:hypothetical protein